MTGKAAAIPCFCTSGSIHRFHPVRKSNRLLSSKGSQQVTFIVRHTSGILRFCRCFAGADISDVTTHRSGHASPYATRKGSRPITSTSTSVRSAAYPRETVCATSVPSTFSSRRSASLFSFSVSHPSKRSFWFPSSTSSKISCGIFTRPSTPWCCSHDQNSATRSMG